jgi:hypothetical protein
MNASEGICWPMISLPIEPPRPADGEANSCVLPAVWCRRILTSLSRRKLPDRAAGSLEMLLTYFIELHPPAESFLSQLTEYAEGSRLGLAEAADTLRRAWQDGHGDLAVAAPPLQETLRTLGARLDDAGAHAAYIAITAEQVQVQTFGELTECSLDPMELRLEIASRLALRGRVAPADADAPLPYETRLRMVGSDLEDEASQAYELFVTPRTVVVEGSEGYYRSCTLDELLGEGPPAGTSAAAPPPPALLRAAVGSASGQGGRGGRRGRRRR